MYRLMFERVRGWACLVVLILLVIPGSAYSQAPDANDVSSMVAWLGQPTITRYANPQDAFARNAWDLEVYEGHIYIASGNSHGNVRGGKSGPVDLWYYDPATDQFKLDLTVEEEEIEHFVPIADALFIPGYDSRGSWLVGNIYFLRRGVWKTWNTIPRAIHVYDVERDQGRIFAAIGSDNSTGFSLVSTLNGQTWNYHIIPPEMRNNFPSTLTWELFKIEGELYVSVQVVVTRVETLTDPSDVSYQAMNSPFFRVLLNGNTVTFMPIRADFFADTLPQTDPPSQPTIVRPVEWGNTTIYIGAYRPPGDHWMSFGLYSIDGSLVSRYYPFDEGETVRDVIATEEQVFALLSLPQPDGSYRVRVVATCDLDSWHEVLRFERSTFARSFALYDGVFYFGLGTDADTLAQESGGLLSVGTIFANMEC